LDDVSFYQQILIGLQQAILPGVATVRDQLVFWFSLLLWLQALRVVYGLFWNGHILESALAMLIKGAVCWWFLYNYQAFFEGLVRFFVGTGLTFSGGAVSVAQFLDPGEYLRIATRVAQPLKQAMDNSMGLTTVGLALGYFLLWLGMYAAFAVMALNIFIWQVEILLASAVGMLLIPTLLTRWTAFAGGGIVSFIVNKAFKMGAAATMVGLTFPLVQKSLTLTQGPVSLSRVVVVVIGAWCFSALFFTVSRLAGGMIAGIPQSGVGDLVRHAVATVVGGVALGAGGTALAAGGTSLALRAGSRGLLMAGARATATAGTPQLATRMGTIAAQYAGTSGRLAASSGVRSFRHFADLTRYVGSDHTGHLGARR
jgi:type IV secretion system protein TrbL